MTTKQLRKFFSKEKSYLVTSRFFGDTIINLRDGSFRDPRITLYPSFFIEVGVKIKLLNFLEPENKNNTDIIISIEGVDLPGILLVAPSSHILCSVSLKK